MQNVVPSTSLPTPPDNPTIIVLRFQPGGAERALPATGTIIAEHVTHFLWRSAVLNLEHHWLCWRYMEFLRRWKSSPEQIANRVPPAIDAYLRVTGTYVLRGGRLKIKMWMFSTVDTECLTPRAIATACAEGDVANLSGIVDEAARALLDEWYPPALEYLRAANMIDASPRAVELVCAGIDSLAFGVEGRDLADIYFRKALEREPDSGYVRFAACATLPGRWTVERCKEVLRLSPGYVPAMFPLVETGECDEDEVLVAWRLYFAGLEHVPFNSEAYFEARRLAIALNDFDSVMRLCKRHATRGTFRSGSSEFGDTFLSAAEKAEEAGNLNMARSICCAGLELAEDDRGRSGLLAKLGDVAREEDRLDDAAGSYREALELDPFVPWRTARASVLRRLGRMEEARAELNLVVNVDSGADRRSRNYAHLQLAELCEIDGDIRSARAHYRAVVGRTNIDLESYQALTASFEALRLLKDCRSQ